MAGHVAWDTRAAIPRVSWPCCMRLLDSLALTPAAWPAPASSLGEGEAGRQSAQSIKHHDLVGTGLLQQKWAQTQSRIPELSLPSLDTGTSSPKMQSGQPLARRSARWTLTQSIIALPLPHRTSRWLGEDFFTPLARSQIGIPCLENYGSCISLGVDRAEEVGGTRQSCPCCHTWQTFQTQLP